MSENLLTVDQAAARLQLSPTSVRIHLRGGKLRGVKRGRAWRVPESALFEHAPEARTVDNNSTLAQADAIWAAMASGDYARRNTALKTLLHDAPAAVLSIVTQRSSEVAGRFYATLEGREELSDWRALQGEPFHDDLGEYDNKDSQ